LATRLSAESLTSIPHTQIRRWLASQGVITLQGYSAYSLCWLRTQFVAREQRPPSLSWSLLSTELSIQSYHDDQTIADNITCLGNNHNTEPGRAVSEEHVVTPSNPHPASYFYDLVRLEIPTACRRTLFMDGAVVSNGHREAPCKAPLCQLAIRPKRTKRIYNP
jgi:hypothetical protein